MASQDETVGACAIVTRLWKFLLLIFLSGSFVTSHAETIDFNSFPADTTDLNDINPVIPGEFESLDPENTQVRFDDSLPGEKSLRIPGFSDSTDIVFRFPNPVDFVVLTFSDNANGGLDVIASFFAQTLQLSDVNMFSPVSVFADIEPVVFTYTGDPILTVAIDTESSDIQLHEISWRVAVPEPSTLALFGIGLIGMVFVRSKRND